MTRMKMKGLLWAGSLLMLLAFASFVLCAEQLPSGGEVVIGDITALSGGVAAMGVPWDKGAKLAAAEINSAGGLRISGKKYTLKIESYDDEATPAKSVVGLRRFKQQYNIPVVLMALSGPTLAVLEINQSLGVLVITCATAPAITEMGNKLLLRPPQTGQEEVGKFARIAADTLGKVEYAIMADVGEWGKYQESFFRKAMTELGGKIVASEWFTEATQTDFYPQLTKIRGINPKAIYLPAHDDPAILIVKQARELGIKVPFIFPMGAMTDKARARIDPELIEGCYVGINRWDVKTEEPLRFGEKYIKKYGETAATHSAMAWECTWIVARAMEKAGTTTDAHKIREACLKVVPLPKHIGIVGQERFDPVTGQGRWWRVLGLIKNGKVAEQRE